MFSEFSCARLSLHAPPVDDRDQPAEAAADPLLTAEEEVLGNVEHRHHRQVLVDGFDTQGLGGDRAGHVDPSPIDEDLTGVRLQHSREDLDQSRLSGAVVADQTQHLSGEQVEINLTQGLDVTESLRDASCLQNRRCGGDRRQPVATAHRQSRQAFQLFSGPVEPIGPGALNAGSPHALAASAKPFDVAAQAPARSSSRPAPR